MSKTDFTELTGSKYPIQLAGMPGVATPELAAAVSNAGGLGMISAAYKSADYLSSEIRQIKELTPAPVGVNFLMPFLDRDCVHTAAEVARLVEFFYGEPEPELIDIVHGSGALACWQTGSLDEALSAEDAGCDIIVAQGIEAGGHVRGKTKLAELLSSVIQRVRVPVIAAGGIANGSDIARVLKLGASAVRMGTVFIAARESGAHPEYVNALIRAEAGDTELTETFTAEWSAPHRVLRSCVKAVETFKGENVGERSLGGVTKPVPRKSITLPTKNTTGKIDAMALYASDSVRAVKEERTVLSIMEELMSEAAS